MIPPLVVLAINSVIELVGKHAQHGPVIEEEFSTNMKFFENLLTVAVDRGEHDNCDLHVKKCHITIASETERACTGARVVLLPIISAANYR